jgi:UDP-3-O-[3-hydroxymyristoyl] glucosamine N-acyltransferase
MDINTIASLINAKVVGKNFEVTGMATLADAKPSEISFLSNSKYAKTLQSTKAGAVIVDENSQKYLPENCVALVVKHPYWEMAVLSEYFSTPIEDDNLEDAQIAQSAKIAPEAVIAKGAKIGENCRIMANSYIGNNVEIGDNTIIYPNVTVYKECKIGKNCIIHANSVIGGDGFGFATSNMGEHKKIYQNGNVVLEDDIEIGSCTTIDRAAFGSTLIKQGVRIDNLVQIGHNCVIGEYSVIVSQAGISGSTEMGRNVVMGGQSATAGHLTIAPFSTMAARSGVTKSIKESGKTFAGFPLMNHRAWLKLQGKLARLIK